MGERIQTQRSAPDSARIAGPAHERMQARHELGERERLGHVVVPTGAEAGDAVGERIASREEQHRRLHALRTKRLADVAPVGVRQADVDDQDARRLWLDPSEQFRAGADTDRLEPLLTEPAQQHPAKVGVVLDHQHLRHGTRVDLPSS
jgi:hypothetical protein